MKIFLFRLFLPLLAIVTGSGVALSSDMIKVLIVNEVYSKIPAKNEKIERLGSMEGDLLLMGTRYAGNIDVWRGDKGLYIVNELPLEEYVKDVVAAEVSGDWDMEALKAQAVISRTYALYQKGINGNPLYHVASSVLHQVYKGKNPDVRVAYAVSQTAHEILTFEGKLIAAFYHSTCGGRTENVHEVFGSHQPYLKSVESECTLSPYSSWERKVPREEIEDALSISGIKSVEVKAQTSTNRVKQLAFETDSNAMLIDATELRKILGWNRLPSTNFKVQMDGNSILFVGNGYGHGVGLCQWCALKMAREGKTYREILSFFYPGTAIQIHEDR